MQGAGGAIAKRPEPSRGQVLAGIGELYAARAGGGAVGGEGRHRRAHVGSKRHAVVLILRVHGRGTRGGHRAQAVIGGHAQAQAGCQHSCGERGDGTRVQRGVVGAEGQFVVAGESAVVVVVNPDPYVFGRAGIGAHADGVALAHYQGRVGGAAQVLVAFRLAHRIPVDEVVAHRHVENAHVEGTGLGATGPAGGAGHRHGTSLGLGRRRCAQRQQGSHKTRGKPGPET